jgi:hypothetical protein
VQYYPITKLLILIDKWGMMYQMWKASNREWHFKMRREAPWYHLVKHARAKCNKSGVPFDLDNDWARSRWTGCCEMSGIPFEVCQSKQGMFCPSLDRIDHSRGYIKDNCRFILFGLNAFKQQSSDDVVLSVCRAVLESSTR